MTSLPTTGIKPCPKCKSTDLMLANAPWQVWCKNPECMYRGPKTRKPTIAKAIEAWNKETRE